jgi:hypothetical protein
MRLVPDRRAPAAAHLDSNPTNNQLKNLRALCQRCHMLHDRPRHLAQRWRATTKTIGGRTVEKERIME